MFSDILTLLLTRCCTHKRTGYSVTTDQGRAPLIEQPRELLAASKAFQVWSHVCDIICLRVNSMLVALICGAHTPGV